MLAERKTRWPSSVTAGFEQDVAELFLQRDLFADRLAVFEQRLVGGIDDNDPVEPVQQRVLAGFESPRLRFSARRPQESAATAP